eukprot:TRINITY_DN6568_c0_g1_i1.p1 TRINITY_DN6568_c0_g1~~TRINITY_DN6568_c0_g1_i1.p1  ORF type:complete len:500 (+),score=25.36 TRINITY_DN6568_c0_g1_i1:192-1691(+)
MLSEPSCQASIDGWKELTFLGQPVNYNKIVDIAADPGNNFGSYYKDDVLPKTGLPLALTIIWILIFIVYIIWRLTLLVMCCCCCCCRRRNQKESDLDYDKYTAILNGKASRNSKIILALCGVGACIWYVYGIVTLSAEPNVANNLFEVAESFQGHLQLIVNEGYNLSESFLEIPVLVQQLNQTEYLSDVADEDDLFKASQVQAQVNEIATQASEMVNTSMSSLETQAVTPLSDAIDNYSTEAEAFYAAVKEAAVYILFPILIAILIIAILCSVFNFTVGMEISVLVIIISTLLVVLIGLITANVVIMQNDVCSNNRVIIINVVQDLMGQNNAISAFVQYVLEGGNGGIASLLKQYFGFNSDSIDGQIQQLNSTIIQLSETGKVPEVSLDKIFSVIDQLPLQINNIFDLLSHTSLQVYYLNLEDIACCQLRDFIINYNSVVVIGTIATIPMLVAMLVWLHYLRELPPSKLFCGFCCCRSGREFKTKMRPAEEPLLWHQGR